MTRDRRTPTAPADREPESGTETGYAAYLALDRLLSLQTPKTEEPDEGLFIVVHQAHELWFMQLLAVVGELGEDLLAGRAGPALRTLDRALRVMHVLDAHVDVLETMSPGRFHSFRSALGSASGFASAQFRELEVALGRRDEGVLRGFAPGSGERLRIEAALRRPPLLDALMAHLGVPAGADEEARTAAVAAAYAADGTTARVCEGFVDLDQAVQRWRFRHMGMARRLIGSRPGTNGSSGVGYLRSTLDRTSFAPLWAARDVA